MGRKPSIRARKYSLTPEALRQRKQAAVDRWQARQDKESRSLSGRPRKKRGPKRDSRGRFVGAK